jgi:uncharacterized YccA/Bax inhibitor family protein
MESSNPLLKRDQAFSRDFAQSDAMTLDGVTYKTGMLLLMCMGTAAYAWTHPELQFPLVIIGMIGGLIACLVGTFAPKTAPISAPAYALLEGLCLGAISHVIEKKYPGIVGNAVLLTFGVLGLMLTLYITRTIRVTGKLVAGILAATVAVLLVYVVDMVLHFCGVQMPFLHDSGPIGIGISLVIVGIAAFNLLLDFAVIEDGVTNGSPRYMEWYCGMALLVTLVWLYFELLRLLAKLRGRD